MTRKNRVNRQAMFFSVVLAVALAAFNLIRLFPDQRPIFFTCAFFLSMVAMLGLRRYWPDHWGRVPVVIMAVFARGLLLPLEPSDDLNRYLWET